eukprot:gene7211-5068_t
MFSDRPVGGASLLFHVFLLISLAWAGIWFAVTVSLLGLKGSKLPFSPAALPLEIIACVLVTIVDFLAFLFGKQGNLTEEVKTIALSLAFLLVSLCGALYFMWFQSYVMRLDLAFSAIFLGINALTIFSGIWAIHQASSQAVLPSYLLGESKDKKESVRIPLSIPLNAEVLYVLPDFCFMEGSFRANKTLNSTGKILGELDDGIELAFLLPKVDYPRNTQVPVLLQTHIAQTTSELSEAQVRNISTFIQLFPDSLNSFLESVFSVDSFTQKFVEILQSMELEDVILFSNAVSRGNDPSQLESRNKELLEGISISLLNSINGIDPADAFRLLLQCEFPMWKYTKGLPQKVDSMCRRLDSHYLLNLILSLDKSKRNHREWGVVFQQILCRSIAKLQCREVIALFEKLSILHIPIRGKVWEEILKYTTTILELESLECLCSSMELLTHSSDSIYLKFQKKVIDGLKKQILNEVNASEQTMNTRNIRLLLCYGYIDKDQARKVFTAIDNTKVEPSDASLLPLCKLMYTVGEYPKALVSNLCGNTTKRHSQEESIFLLNSIFYSGLPIRESYLQEAVGPYAFRQFSSKKGSRHSPLSRTCTFLLLNVLCHLDATKYDPKLFPVSSILSHSSLSIAERLQLLSASVRHNNNPALSKVFLQDVLARARQCNDQQLQTVFLALAALRMREAVVFTKLLRIAEEMKPTVSLALSAAKAARYLKLTQQFAKTTLVESIKNLSGTNFETFIELLKYCTKPQRHHLVQLPGGAELLEKADLNGVSTSSLLILANTSSVQHKEFIRLLKERPPLKPGDVIDEEVVMNLEETQKESETELILKIGGPCLEDMDERQLMRVYRCLARLQQCPNIAFRIIGRGIIKNIKSLTADEALLWLNLYVRYEIRDDAVAKVLLKKAQSRRAWVSKELENQMLKAETFFGVPHQRIAYCFSLSTYSCVATKAEMSTSRLSSLAALESCAFAEVKKLVPLLANPSAHETKRLSVAAFIAATAHAASTAHDPLSHAKDCLVARQVVPLPRIASNKEFMDRPCQTCLSLRVHHLSSGIFCSQFSRKCDALVPNSIPPSLQEEIEKSFGSVEGCRKEVINFATSCIGSGRTWMAVEPAQRKIVLVNMPNSDVPLTMNLWPLAVVDMTEEVLSRTVQDSVTRLSHEQNVAPWSRAARTHRNMAISNERKRFSLAEAREHVGNQAWNKLNWEFVDSQLRQALTYYGSKNRELASAHWREKRERIAKGITESSQTSSRNATPRDEMSEEAQGRSSVANKLNLNNAAQPTPPTVANPTQNDEPEAIHHPDTGAWEYVYKNKKRTFRYEDGTNVFVDGETTTTVKPDGTEIYEQNGIRTTVSPDKSTLFEYPDGSSNMGGREDRCTVSSIPIKIAPTASRLLFQTNNFLIDITKAACCCARNFFSDLSGDSASVCVVLVPFLIHRKRIAAVKTLFFRMENIDPAIYTRNVMRFCLEAVEKSNNKNDNHGITALEALNYGAYMAHREGQTGGCPAVVVTIRDGKTGSILNLGDCGVLIVRNSKVLFQSQQQQHFFNCPFQLPTDMPSAGDQHSLDLKNEDILLCASDGVWDNVDVEDLVSHLKEVKQVGCTKVATNIGYHASKNGNDRKFMSPFAKQAMNSGYRYQGGKLDDITALVAMVTSMDEQTTNSTQLITDLLENAKINLRMRIRIVIPLPHSLPPINYIYYCPPSQLFFFFVAQVVQKNSDAESNHRIVAAIIDSTVRPLIERLLQLPLNSDISDYNSTDECCPEVAAARNALSEEMNTDDVWFFLYRVASSCLERRIRKRSRNGAADVKAAVTNAFTLFCNRGVPSLDKIRIRWTFLKKEKNTFEASDDYVNANAAERRKFQISSVLSVFSERAHRHAFTSLWLQCIQYAGEAALHAHLLYRLGTVILPSLTNPLVVADYLAECFRSGGLIAVLALQGVFILMLDHGLEYPQYYKQLYSLITADAFASRHRYDLFRLLDLSMSSLRVPSYIAASVIKRIAQVSLLAPSPTLYFSLPFIRKVLQGHPNCLALIHRSSREAVVPDELLTGNADDSIKAKRDAAQRTAELFHGIDPFAVDADPDSTHALCSTLWEFAVLERHYLPKIPLMISAFSSTAQDKTPLQFEKSYGRLFTAEVTRRLDGRDVPPLAYQEPEILDGKGLLTL